MKRRLTRAILLLYPRRVREGHGPEITALIDDLITHEARSRTRLLIRLTVDGLVQRTASTATIWTVTAVLTATGLGGLAVSDFAAANALPRARRTEPGRRDARTRPAPSSRWHCSSRRPRAATRSMRGCGTPRPTLTARSDMGQSTRRTVLLCGL